MMMKRRKRLKTAIYRKLCIILPFSPKSPRAACRLILVGLLLCVAAAIAVHPATAEQKKSEKPYALILALFGDRTITHGLVSGLRSVA